MIAAAMGSMTNGHDECPPVPLLVCCSHVDIMGTPAAHIGHETAMHGCEAHDPHSGIVLNGHSHCDIWGYPMATVGSIVMGGKVVIPPHVCSSIGTCDVPSVVLGPCPDCHVSVVSK